MSSLPVVLGLTANGQLLLGGLATDRHSLVGYTHIFTTDTIHVQQPTTFEAESWSGEHAEREHDDTSIISSSFEHPHLHHQDTTDTEEDTPIASSSQFERARSASLAAALLNVDPKGVPLVHFFHPTVPQVPLLEAEEEYQGTENQDDKGNYSAADCLPQPNPFDEVKEAEKVLSDLLFTLREIQMTDPYQHACAVKRLKDLEAELRIAGAVTPADPAVSEAVARALAAAGPGRDVQIRVNQSRHTTTTKTVYETETPGMVGLDSNKIRELHQQMLDSLSSATTEPTADAGTTQKKETAEEGFTNEDGSVVVSKKMTRVVTTTRTTLPGDSDETQQTLGSPVEESSSVRDKIARFESLKLAHASDVHTPDFIVTSSEKFSGTKEQAEEEPLTASTENVQIAEVKQQPESQVNSANAEKCFMRELSTSYELDDKTEIRESDTISTTETLDESMFREIRSRNDKVDDDSPRNTKELTGLELGKTNNTVTKDYVLVSNSSSKYESDSHYIPSSEIQSELFTSVGNWLPHEAENGNGYVEDSNSTVDHSTRVGDAQPSESFLLEEEKERSIMDKIKVSTESVPEPAFPSYDNNIGSTHSATEDNVGPTDQSTELEQTINDEITTSTTTVDEKQTVDDDTLEAIETHAESIVFSQQSGPVQNMESQNVGSVSENTSHEDFTDEPHTRQDDTPNSEIMDAQDSEMNEWARSSNVGSFSPQPLTDPSIDMYIVPALGLNQESFSHVIESSEYFESHGALQEETILKEPVKSHQLSEQVTEHFPNAESVKEHGIVHADDISEQHSETDLLNQFSVSEQPGDRTSNSSTPCILPETEEIQENDTLKSDNAPQEETILGEPVESQKLSEQVTERFPNAESLEEHKIIHSDDNSEQHSEADFLNQLSDSEQLIEETLGTSAIQNLPEAEEIQENDTFESDDALQEKTIFKDPVKSHQLSEQVTEHFPNAESVKEHGIVHADDISEQHSETDLLNQFSVSEQPGDRTSNSSTPCILPETEEIQENDTLKSDNAPQEETILNEPVESHQLSERITEHSSNAESVEEHKIIHSDDNSEQHSEADFLNQLSDSEQLIEETLGTSAIQNLPEAEEIQENDSLESDGALQKETILNEQVESHQLSEQVTEHFLNEESADEHENDDADDIKEKKSGEDMIDHDCFNETSNSSSVNRRVSENRSQKEITDEPPSQQDDTPNSEVLDAQDSEMNEWARSSNVGSFSPQPLADSSTDMYIVPELGLVQESFSHVIESSENRTDHTYPEAKDEIELSEKQDLDTDDASIDIGEKALSFAKKVGSIAGAVAIAPVGLAALGVKTAYDALKEAENTDQVSTSSGYIHQEVPIYKEQHPSIIPSHEQTHPKSLDSSELPDLRETVETTNDDIFISYRTQNKSTVSSLPVEFLELSKQVTEHFPNESVEKHGIVHAAANSEQHSEADLLNQFSVSEQPGDRTSNSSTPCILHEAEEIQENDTFESDVALQEKTILKDPFESHQLSERVTEHSSNAESVEEHGIVHANDNSEQHSEADLLNQLSDSEKLKEGTLSTSTIQNLPEAEEIQENDTFESDGALQEEFILNEPVESHQLSEQVTEHFSNAESEEEHGIIHSDDNSEQHSEADRLNQLSDSEKLKEETLSTSTIQNLPEAEEIQENDTFESDGALQEETILNEPVESHQLSEPVTEHSSNAEPVEEHGIVHADDNSEQHSEADRLNQLSDSEKLKEETLSTSTIQNLPEAEEIQENDTFESDGALQEETILNEPVESHQLSEPVTEHSSNAEPVEEHGIVHADDNSEQHSEADRLNQLSDSEKLKEGTLSTSTIQNLPEAEEIQENDTFESDGALQEETILNEPVESHQLSERVTEYFSNAESEEEHGIIHSDDNSEQHSEADRLNQLSDSEKLKEETLSTSTIQNLPEAGEIQENDYFESYGALQEETILNEPVESHQLSEPVTEHSSNAEPVEEHGIIHSDDNSEQHSEADRLNQLSDSEKLKEETLSTSTIQNLPEAEEIQENDTFESDGALQEETILNEPVESHQLSERVTEHFSNAESEEEHGIIHSDDNSEQHSEADRLNQLSDSEKLKEETLSTSTIQNLPEAGEIQENDYFESNGALQEETILNEPVESHQLSEPLTEDSSNAESVEEHGIVHADDNSEQHSETELVHQLSDSEKLKEGTLSTSTIQNLPEAEEIQENDTFESDDALQEKTILNEPVESHQLSERVTEHSPNAESVEEHEIIHADDNSEQHSETELVHQLSDSEKLKEGTLSTSTIQNLPEAEEIQENDTFESDGALQEETILNEPVESHQLSERVTEDSSNAESVEEHGIVHADDNSEQHSETELVHQLSDSEKLKEGTLSTSTIQNLPEAEEIQENDTFESYGALQEETILNEPVESHQLSEPLTEDSSNAESVEEHGIVHADDNSEQHSETELVHQLSDSEKLKEGTLSTSTIQNLPEAEEIQENDTFESDDALQEKTILNEPVESHQLSERVTEHSPNAESVEEHEIIHSDDNSEQPSEADRLNQLSDSEKLKEETLSTSTIQNVPEAEEIQENDTFESDGALQEETILNEPVESHQLSERVTEHSPNAESVEEHEIIHSDDNSEQPSEADRLNQLSDSEKLKEETLSTSTIQNVPEAEEIQENDTFESDGALQEETILNEPVESHQLSERVTEHFPNAESVEEHKRIHADDVSEQHSKTDLLYQFSVSEQPRDRTSNSSTSCNLPEAGEIQENDSLESDSALQEETILNEPVEPHQLSEQVTEHFSNDELADEHENDNADDITEKKSGEHMIDHDCLNETSFSSSVNRRVSVSENRSHEDITDELSSQQDDTPNSEVLDAQDSEMNEWARSSNVGSFSPQPLADSSTDMYIVPELGLVQESFSHVIESSENRTDHTYQEAKDEIELSEKQNLNTDDANIDIGEKAMSFAKKVGSIAGAVAIAPVGLAALGVKTAYDALKEAENTDQVSTSSGYIHQEVPIYEEQHPSIIPSYEQTHPKALDSSELPELRGTDETTNDDIFVTYRSQNENTISSLRLESLESSKPMEAVLPESAEPSQELELVTNKYSLEESVDEHEKDHADDITEERSGEDMIDHDRSFGETLNLRSVNLPEDEVGLEDSSVASETFETFQRLGSLSEHTPFEESVNKRDDVNTSNQSSQKASAAVIEDISYSAHQQPESWNSLISVDMQEMKEVENIDALKTPINSQESSSWSELERSMQNEEPVEKQCPDEQSSEIKKSESHLIDSSEYEVLHEYHEVKDEVRLSQERNRDDDDTSPGIGEKALSFAKKVGSIAGVVAIAPVGLAALGVKSAYDALKEAEDTDQVSTSSGYIHQQAPIYEEQQLNIIPSHEPTHPKALDSSELPELRGTVETTNDDIFISHRTQNKSTISSLPVEFLELSKQFTEHFPNESVEKHGIVHAAGNSEQHSEADLLNQLSDSEKLKEGTLSTSTIQNLPEAEEIQENDTFESDDALQEKTILKDPVESHQLSERVTEHSSNAESVEEHGKVHADDISEQHSEADLLNQLSDSEKLKEETLSTSTIQNLPETEEIQENDTFESDGALQEETILNEPVELHQLSEQVTEHFPRAKLEVEHEIIHADDISEQHSEADLLNQLSDSEKLEEGTLSTSTIQKLPEAEEIQENDTFESDGALQEETILNEPVELHQLSEQVTEHSPNAESMEEHGIVHADDISEQHSEADLLNQLSDSEKLEEGTLSTSTIQKLPEAEEIQENDTFESDGALQEETILNEPVILHQLSEPLTEDSSNAESVEEHEIIHADDNSEQHSEADLLNQLSDSEKLKEGTLSTSTIQNLPEVEEIQENDTFEFDGALQEETILNEPVESHQLSERVTEHSPNAESVEEHGIVHADDISEQHSEADLLNQLSDSEKLEEGTLSTSTIQKLPEAEEIQENDTFESDGALQEETILNEPVESHQLSERVIEHSSNAESVEEHGIVHADDNCEQHSEADLLNQLSDSEKLEERTLSISTIQNLPEAEEIQENDTFEFDGALREETILNEPVESHQLSEPLTEHFSNAESEEEHGIVHADDNSEQHSEAKLVHQLSDSEKLKEGTLSTSTIQNLPEAEEIQENDTFESDDALQEKTILNEPVESHQLSERVTEHSPNAESVGEHGIVHADDNSEQHSEADRRNQLSDSEKLKEETLSTSTIQKLPEAEEIQENDTLKSNNAVQKETILNEPVEYHQLSERVTEHSSNAESVEEHGIVHADDNSEQHSEADLLYQLSDSGKLKKGTLSTSTKQNLPEAEEIQENDTFESDGALQEENILNEPVESHQLSERVTEHSPNAESVGEHGIVHADDNSEQHSEADLLNQLSDSEKLEEGTLSTSTIQNLPEAEEIQENDTFQSDGVLQEQFILNEPVESHQLSEQVTEHFSNAESVEEHEINNSDDNSEQKSKADLLHQFSVSEQPGDRTSNSSTSCNLPEAGEIEENDSLESDGALQKETFLNERVESHQLSEQVTEHFSNDELADEHENDNADDITEKKSGEDMIDHDCLNETSFSSSVNRRVSVSENRSHEDITDELSSQQDDTPNSEVLDAQDSEMNEWARSSNVGSFSPQPLADSSTDMYIVPELGLVQESFSHVIESSENRTDHTYQEAKDEIELSEKQNLNTDDANIDIGEKALSFAKKVGSIAGAVAIAPVGLAALGVKTAYDALKEAENTDQVSTSSGYIHQEVPIYKEQHPSIIPSHEQTHPKSLDSSELPDLRETDQASSTVLAEFVEPVQNILNSPSSRNLCENKKIEIDDLLQSVEPSQISESSTVQSPDEESMNQHENIHAVSNSDYLSGVDVLYHLSGSEHIGQETLNSSTSVNVLADHEIQNDDILKSARGDNTSSIISLPIEPSQMLETETTCCSDEESAKEKELSGLKDFVSSDAVKDELFERVGFQETRESDIVDSYSNTNVVKNISTSYTEKDNEKYPAKLDEKSLHDLVEEAFDNVNRMHINDETVLVSSSDKLTVTSISSLNIDESTEEIKKEEWRVFDDHGLVVEEFSNRLAERVMTEVSREPILPQFTNVSLSKQESCNEVTVEPEIDYQSDLQEKLDILASQSRSQLEFGRDEEQLDIIHESDFEKEHQELNDTNQSMLELSLDDASKDIIFLQKNSVQENEFEEISRHEDDNLTPEEVEDGFLMYSHIRKDQDDDGELETVEEEPEDSDSVNGSGHSSIGAPSDTLAMLGKYRHVSSDNVSLNSLQEFERLEQLVANRGDNSLTSSEIELYAASRLRSGEGSVNSLAEFEKLEQDLAVQGTANSSPQEEMMLSVVKEESEAEEMSTHDDEEYENDHDPNTSYEVNTLIKEISPGNITPADSLENINICEVNEIFATSTDSLEPVNLEINQTEVTKILKENVMETSFDVCEDMSDNLRDSLENITQERDSLLEGASQEMASQETRGMLSGDTLGTYQEHDDDDKDSLGELDNILASYPSTLTTFETTALDSDGTIKKISRSVETRVRDPILSHVAFTGTENEERLLELPAGEQIETVDSEGNVTRTTISHQSTN